VGYYLETTLPTQGAAAPPTYTTPTGDVRAYATEEELLEFANKVRVAGGADPLDALVPSEPGNPRACLIANAVNFHSRVAGGVGLPALPSGQRPWVMHLPDHVTEERAYRIAAAVRCELHMFDVGNGVVPRYCAELCTHFGVVLPERIGNTAGAFDQGVGWTTKYAKPFDPLEFAAN